MAHPYRSHGRIPVRPPEDEVPIALSVGTAVFIWLISVARFALAVGGGERFGFEPALALLLCVLVPAALARSRR
jgi:hypothetical protein